MGRICATTGKTRYPSEAQAVGADNSIIGIYLCPTCEGWHRTRAERWRQPIRQAESARSSCPADLRRLPWLDQTLRMAPPHLFRVILPVSDIEAAATFYARLLEMPGTRVSSGRHYFDCAGTILACYNALADGDPEPVGPNPQHVYFSVDDLDAAHARAKEAGCSELTGIELRPWGERSFYAGDPFGNPICFVDSQTLFTGEHPWARTPHT